MLKYSIESLRGKIVLSLLLLIIIPVLFIVYQSYESSKKILETQLNQANQTAIERKAAMMDELNTRIIKASNLIMNNEETHKFIRDMDEWVDKYPDFYAYKMLMAELSSYRNLLFESSAHLAIYDIYQEYVHTTWLGSAKTNFGSLSQESWFIDTKQLKGQPYWFLSDNPPAESGKPMLVMSRWLFSEQKKGDGIVWIGVSTETYFYSQEELKKQADKGNFLFLLSGDQILLGDQTLLEDISTFDQGKWIDDEGINRIELNGQEYLINETVMSSPNWRLVQLIDSQTFSNQLEQERKKTTLLVVFWFFLFTVAFVWLMFRFTKPIRQLVNSMNQVGKGALKNTEVIVRGRDEVAILGRNFNKMVRQLQQLITDLSEEQQRKQKAQFEALQAQINPHFLTNTMNSIKWMAILSGSGHVSEMLSKLGKLLNYSMRQHEVIVRLHEEIDYLQVYMALQEIRYHDNISVTVKIPDNLMDAEIVKFTLQPLVENSIIHSKRFPLHIHITAEMTDNELQVFISDDGVGLSEKAIRDVEKQMNQPHAKFSGIGIRNVNERIKLEFGENYGVTLRNRDEGGGQAIVKLPFRRRSGQNAANTDR